MTYLDADKTLIVRTAGKPWTCKDCGRAIQRGEVHVEYVGEVPAYASGSRHCMACYKAIWESTP